MPLEQILQVDWSKTLPILLDQVKLFLHKFVFVLEGQFRVVVHELDNVTCFYVVLLFEIVENAHKIRDFDSKNTTRVLHQIDDLLLSHSVFTELTIELVNFGKVAAVKIRERLKHVIDLCWGYPVIYMK